MRGRGGSSCRFECIYFILLWALQHRWSAPHGPRGEGEGEARDWRVPGRFPVGRAERCRDLPCEAVAKTVRRSKKTRFYLVIYSVYANNTALRRWSPQQSPSAQSKHRWQSVRCVVFGTCFSYLLGQPLWRTGRRIALSFQCLSAPGHPAIATPSGTSTPPSPCHKRSRGAVSRPHS